MALFKKRQESSNAMPFYTLGLQKTLLVVGLGNPGDEYNGTRHNIGFAVIDEFAAKMDFPGWTLKKDLKCHLTAQTIASSRVIVIKPSTFMNLSGEAVQATQQFYKIPDSQLIVVHDELDIPFGQIRTRMGGSDAGHNGVKSIIQNSGDNFGRVRVGIGSELSKKADGKDFVLGKFSKQEQEQMSALLKETTALLSEYTHGQILSNETRSFII